MTRLRSNFLLRFGSHAEIVNATFRLADPDPRRSAPVHLHIFEIAGLVVDAYLGGRDPGGELATLPARLHQALDEGAIVLGRHPLVLLRRPLRIAQDFARGRAFDVAELADLAIEGDVG